MWATDEVGTKREKQMSQGAGGWRNWAAPPKIIEGSPGR